MRPLITNAGLFVTLLLSLSACDLFCDCEAPATPCLFTYEQLIYTSNGEADPQIASPNFEGDQPAGTFSSQPAGLAIDSLTGEIDVNASAAGEYAVVYTLDDGQTTCETKVAIKEGPVKVEECVFSYETEVIVPGQKDLLRPVFQDKTELDGTFTAVPPGLDISFDEGIISVNTSASGQKYRIIYTSNDKQTHCETELLISGIDYIDQIIDLEDDLPDTASPILDANPQIEAPQGEYDVDGSARAQGLAIAPETGEIDVRETLQLVDELRSQREAPLIEEGEPLKFTFAYQIDNAGDQEQPIISSLQIVIYWFENDISPEIQELLDQKSKFPTNGREMSPPSMLVVRGMR